MSNTKTPAASETLTATVHEHGNGFPDVGDYVAGADGELYEVVSLRGPIHTGQPGQSNYVHATVKLADWSAVTDDNEPVCGASIDE